MAALRSALRGTPPTCALPPPPPSAEYDTSSPTLRSRFSAETLMIKSSPSKSLKSFFSAAAAAAATNPAATEGGGSAPALSSTLTTKRYHRRLSATQAARAAREEEQEEEEEHVRRSPPRLGHFPSASESRLHLDTTSPSYRQPSSPPPPEQTRRGSFAGVGRSRSRSRSRPSLRARRTSSSGNGNGTGTGIGALDAAADKLAGVAREALGKFTASGRHRAPRQQSSETSSARCSSCSSSPPPAAAAALFGPHHSSEGPNQHAREISAGSAATTDSSTTSSSNVHRRGRGRRLAELAAARPRPKHLPANPRPAAPPSPTIPPLKYTSHTTTTTTTTFRAHAIRVPSSETLRSHDYHNLFVRLDVGGQSSYMTTVATLLEAEDGGGKLGEFVAALLVEEGSTASGPSLAPTNEPDPFSPPPPPRLPHSPFPFAADEISLFDHCGGGSTSFFDHPSASPSSIDPLVHTALIGAHFSFSFPHLGDAPSPTTPTLLKVSPSQNAQRVLLVPSPTYASGIRKHTSVYPDFGPPSRASVVVKAEGTAVLPAMVFDELDLPPLRMASSSPSCSSSSGDSESPSSLSSSSEPESFIEFGPGDTPKRPHFEVMREQVSRRQADAAPDRSAPAPEGAAHVRQSLTYGEVQQPEDQMSAVEPCTKPAFGTAASSSVHNRTSSCREMDAAQLCSDAIEPETPRLNVPEEVRQQQERGSSSAQQRSTPLADRTIDIFLDRTDFPISSPHHLAEVGAGKVATVYSALLAFLRGGAFPAAVLSIPDFDPAMSVSGDADSDTGAFLRPGSTAVMFYLATFETIKAEARWLGLHAAERACDRNIKNLYGLATAGGGGGSVRKVQGEKARGREGWI